MFKSLISAAAIAAIFAATTAPAFAGGKYGGPRWVSPPNYKVYNPRARIRRGWPGYRRGWRGGWRHRYYHHHDYVGPALVGGAIGLVTGAIIGSAISRPYYAPPPRYRYYRPRPVRYGPRPWTGRWYRYCAAKYRSFNARTGYYRTYSGHYRFCR